MSGAPEKVRDGTDRAWRQWLAAETEERREYSDGRKRRYREERRAARAEMRTLELHRSAIERAGVISTVPAGAIEPGRGGGDSQILIGTQQLLDDDPRWKECWLVIKHRLRQAHELLDEYEGLGVGSATTMSTEQKRDEVITRGRGYSARAVVDLLGEEIAGSAETVRRDRREAGYAAADGEPLFHDPREQGRCVHCQRTRGEHALGMRCERKTTN